MSEDRGFKSTDCGLLPTKNLARPLPQLYRQWILQEATEATEKMTFPLITRINADKRGLDALESATISATRGENGSGSKGPEFLPQINLARRSRNQRSFGVTTYRAKRHQPTPDIGGDGFNR
jgi:hypothetical protein